MIKSINIEFSLTSENLAPSAASSSFSVCEPSVAAQAAMARAEAMLTGDSTTFCLPRVRLASSLKPNVSTATSVSGVTGGEGKIGEGRM